MPSDDVQSNRLIEEAAKELFTIWHSRQVYLAIPIDEAFEMDKATWLEIAEHVVEQFAELFGVFMPDYK